MNLKLINGKIFQVNKNCYTKAPKILKYKRFLQLCEKSVKLKDVVPGFVCYEGNAKITITSEPFIHYSIPSLFVDCITDYGSGTWSSNISLQDRNVINGGYNLYRLFENKSDSLEYVKIQNSYTYWARDLYGDEHMKYKIKPILGERLDVHNCKYKVREKQNGK